MEKLENNYISEEEIYKKARKAIEELKEASK